MVLSIVVAGFIAASLLDIAIAVLKSRFYSQAAFVITFVEGYYCCGCIYVFIQIFFQVAVGIAGRINCLAALVLVGVQ